MEQGGEPLSPAPLVHPRRAPLLLRLQSGSFGWCGHRGRSRRAVHHWWGHRVRGHSRAWAGLLFRVGASGIGTGRRFSLSHAGRSPGSCFPLALRREGARRPCVAFVLARLSSNTNPLGLVWGAGIGSGEAHGRPGTHQAARVLGAGAPVAARRSGRDRRSPLRAGGGARDVAVDDVDVGGLARAGGSVAGGGLLGPVAIAVYAMVLSLPVWISWWWLKRRG